VSALAALFAALAVILFIGPPVRSRVIIPVPKRASREWTSPAVMWSTTALAAVGAWIFFGGVLGVASAAAVILLVPAALRRMMQQQSPQTALTRQVPTIADMLAAALASGVPVDVALKALARAIEQPAAAHLSRVTRARDLGASPQEAWSDCPAALQVIGQAIERSDVSGAGLHDVLQGIADDARRRHRMQVEIAARTAGVRSVAPLAACFLPAFLLVGVLPVVISLADGMQW
jgi:Flp pilus assembly protein TadB